MDELWEGILRLKEIIKTNTERVDFCFLHYHNGTVTLNENPISTEGFVRIIIGEERAYLPEKIPTIYIENFAQLHFVGTEHLPKEILTFLQKYVLFPFLSLKSQLEDRTIAIAHLAQTLDGKIATSAGYSKWIGNEENLIHAHRMRALCDGVLVGSHTLKEDQPKLTVRHVKGKNPTRIVVGNPTTSFDSLLEDGDAPIYILHYQAIPIHPKVEYFKLPTINNQISTRKILEVLYKLGIQTLYIEGGAATISGFIKDKQADILQLHLAPMLFGSGVSGLQFPNVRLMTEAYTFQHHHFLPIGDAMMFTGFN